MSQQDSDAQLAPIRITGLGDTQCFENINELLSFLQSNAYAEISDSIITNVHVSNIQPTSTQRTDVWFRLNASGKFVGIYMFDGSTWKQVVLPPNEVIWMYGDSSDIPAGFTLVDGSNAKFDAGQVTHIQSFFYPTPGTPPYEYFAVTWDGF